MRWMLARSATVSASADKASGGHKRILASVDNVVIAMSELFNTAVLQTPAPAIAAAQAAALVNDHFDLSGSLTALVSERDQNFLLNSTSGDFVVKFSNAAEDPQVTDFQTSALLHVADTAPDLPVQRVMLNRVGEPMTWVEGTEGRRHCLRLLTYLDGRPLGKLDTTPAHLQHQLGVTLAQLGQALNGFTHPGSRAPLLWDLQHADRLLAVLEESPTDPLQQICRSVLTRFRDELKPGLAPLPSQVIYNDLNPSNVLVTESGAPRVCGVIDFGDITHSARVVDVAVAAAYQLSDGDDPLAGAAHVVAGYCSVAPLLGAELEVLFDLIILRLAITIAITHWRAALYPHNRDYILRNAHAAAARLTALHDLPAAAAQARLTETLERKQTGEARHAG